MKRKELEKRLEKAGLTLEEGGDHTIVKKNGKYVSVVPRHNEIPKYLVIRISKQTGVPL